MLTLHASSRRLPADLTPSPLQAQLDAATGVTRLMESNPTRCDFVYPRIDVPLCGDGAQSYAPDPLGAPAARQALARYAAAHGDPLDSAHLVCTASTSESYGVLLKLLCDAGDGIALGAPSYPLVQHLAALEGVRTVPYDMFYAGRWGIDVDSVARALRRGARALVLISPNNPTGAVIDRDTGAAIARACRAAGVAIIVDQVFAPYVDAPCPSALEVLADAPLVFRLDGLSKAAALPQLKLGWISVHGDDAAVAQVMPRLAWIADAYLSVSTPVLQALPRLLELAPDLQAQVRARVAHNRAILRRALEAVPEIDCLHADGGWYAVLRMPQHVDEDDAVAQLLQQANASLHPGYFYDFVRRGHLVSGLLLPPAAFAAAWERCVPVLRRLCG